MVVRVPDCQPRLRRHRFSISFARRRTVLVGDERAGIFVAYWWLNSITCHSIKRVKKCIFGDIFHPVAAGTCANSQLDDRLYRRCIGAQALETALSLHLRETCVPLRGCGRSPRASLHRTRRSDPVEAATCRAAIQCVKDAMCRVAAPSPPSEALFLGSHRWCTDLLPQAFIGVWTSLFFCRHQERISWSSRSQSSV